MEERIKNFDNNYCSKCLLYTIIIKCDFCKNNICYYCTILKEYKYYCGRKCCNKIIK